MTLNTPGKFILTAGILVVVLFHLLLVSQKEVAAVYRPDDSSLYLSQAYHLVQNSDFGPYTSTVLLKKPGAAFLIASAFWLGIPWAVLLKILFTVLLIASVFLFRKFIGSGIFLPLLFTLILALHPVSYSVSSMFELGRDGINAILLPLFFILVFWVFSIEKLKSKSILGVAGILTLNVLYFLREENFLILGFLSLFLIPSAARILKSLVRRQTISLESLIRVNYKILGFILVSIISIGYLNHVYKQFVNDRYHFYIANDFSEGSYPEFIAALKRHAGICRDNDCFKNTIPYSNLVRIGEEVPEIAQILKHYHKGGYPNSLSFINLKHSFFRSGLYNNLPLFEYQSKAIARKINDLCKKDGFECAPKGKGLFAGYNFHAIPVQFNHMLTHIQMTFANPPYAPSDYSLVHAPEFLAPEDAIVLGKKYERIAGVKVDTLKSYAARSPLVTDIPLELEWKNPAEVVFEMRESIQRAINWIILTGFALWLFRILLAGFAWVKKIKATLNFVDIFVLYLTIYQIIYHLALSYVAVTMNLVDQRILHGLMVTNYIFYGGYILNFIYMFSSIKKEISSLVRSSIKYS